MLRKCRIQTVRKGPCGQRFRKGAENTDLAEYAARPVLGANARRKIDQSTTGHTRLPQDPKNMAFSAIDAHFALEWAEGCRPSNRENPRSKNARRPQAHVGLMACLGFRKNGFL